jgi:epoxyqueuosine reductase
MKDPSKRSVPADPWSALPRRFRVGIRNARIRLDPLLGRAVPVYIDAENNLPAEVLKQIPSLPRPLRRLGPAPIWEAADPDTPEELRGVAGIRRDREAERRAFAERPLHQYFAVFPENVPGAIRHAWNFMLPASPRLGRAIERMSALGGARARAGAPLASSAAPTRSPAELTRSVRAEAARLGLSAVGFAAYDPKYTFAEYAGTHDRGSVVVCAYEQDWAATQTAPGARAERAAFAAYAGLTERAVSLAEFLERQGCRANAHSFAGETMAINYAVEAGLGQLGMNGQLLTPQAGSRVRISVITTDARLIHDEPVDFGIEAICDACQICVRRCPVGAIPNGRREHRGVTKPKIKTERCFPLVAKSEGCAVCMKVCPIQRYGLDAVKRHYLESGGGILGKDTPELEGFTWPEDGRWYGPGEKLEVEQRRRALRPPGWQPLDPRRTEPQQQRRRDGDR